MAKKRKAVKHKRDDKSLMLLAAAAAIIVGFVAIFAYKSSSLSLIPMYSPTPAPMMTVNLKAENGSGEAGTATFQEMNGKVLVVLSLTGFPKGITQPAHIHVGSCPTPGAIKFPLTSVVNGQSTTEVNTTLAALKAMGPLAVNVHKSVAASSVYYSCGNLSL